MLIVKFHKASICEVTGADVKNRNTGGLLLCLAVGLFYLAILFGWVRLPGELDALVRIIRGEIKPNPPSFTFPTAKPLYPKGFPTIGPLYPGLFPTQGTPLRALPFPMTPSPAQNRHP